MSDKPRVSVVVPTYHRPDGLEQAIKSIFKQTIIEQGLDIIIVDNDPAASAADAIDRLKSICPETVTIRADHEPRAGVANARNKAMGLLRTDLVAFLDDDQTAAPDWLEKLLINAERYGTTVSFGPLTTVLPDETMKHHAYFAEFFGRHPGHSNGPIDEFYGICNSLIDFSRIEPLDPWFDEATNETGGEDDMLFHHILTTGGTFSWQSDANVYEHPEARRVNLSYTLRRAVAYGQGPVTLARKSKPPRFDKVIGWMAVGGAKALYHGTIALGMFVIRHPRRAYHYDRTVRGLAKIFWFVGMRFYGAAAAPKPKDLSPEPTSTAAS